MDKKELKEEMAKRRARALRYKKPLVRDLNLENITSTLYDMNEACGNVSWEDEQQLAEILGDEEEASNFRAEYAMLSNDIERAIDDLNDWHTGSELYEECLVACGAGAEGGYIGYDSYEDDYFYLNSYEGDAAVMDMKKRLMRRTKEEIIDGFHYAIRLVALYEGIRYRFDCLETAMAMIRDAQDLTKAELDELDQKYEACDRAGWFEYGPEVHAYNRLLDDLPAECWLK